MGRKNAGTAGTGHAPRATAPGRKTRLNAGEQRLLRRIRGALSLDLRHKSYPILEDDWYFACLEHCYVATEAAYHLFARAEGYVPYVLRHPDGSTHWWLVQKATGKILDPTEPQLGGKPFPYKRGRRAVFLTPQPSRRAVELLRRVEAAQDR